MLTYQAMVDDATTQLYQASETPRIDAEILLQHVLDKGIAWLISYGDTVASSEHTKAFYQLVEQRQNGQPIAYLIGYRDFWTLSLEVNKHVLIPRPDTETLVEAALDCLSQNSEPRLLDLGTGSGAIALSLAKELPQSRVIAVEYQKSALAVAKRNATKNKVNNVEFVLSNWYEKISAENKFDLIASNPPYIEPEDAHLSQGDLRFEPITALSSNENGLADLRIIIENAANYLKPEGHLIVEHGYKQAEDVEALFKKNGFSSIELHKDINDLPRCTIGKIAERKIAQHQND